MMIYTKDVKNYIESGEYKTEMLSIAELAKKIVNYELLSNPNRKVVILDIDETILSNLPYISQQIHLNDIDKLCNWQKKSFCDSIEPMVDFFHWALKKDLDVLFITARPIELRDATLKNFEKLGIEVAPIYFRDPKQWPVPVDFKIAMRRMITDNGGDIILNIGDQPTDFEGGFWKNALRVPNPFYIETELPWQNSGGAAA